MVQSLGQMMHTFSPLSRFVVMYCLLVGFQRSLPPSQTDSRQLQRMSGLDAEYIHGLQERGRKPDHGSDEIGALVKVKVFSVSHVLSSCVMASTLSFC